MQQLPNPAIPLLDPFKRRLNYLRLSVTDLCNFKCQYCLPKGYQGKTPKNELSVNEIENLVATFAYLGTQKVRLTGGEPTLRRDINEIIQVCKQPEQIQKVALTTNGWKLEQHYKSLIGAGLDQINISIDSLDRDTFKSITGKDSLASILKAIEALLNEESIGLKINAVLLKSYGKQQLKEALEFVKSMPVSFRFIELMQTNDNHNEFKQSHLTAANIVSHLEAEGWSALPRLSTAGPAIEYVHPDYAGNIGVIAPYSKDFCKTCNRLRITSTGKLHLCLFDSLAFDIRPYLQEDKQSSLVEYLTSIIEKKPLSHHLKNEDSGLTQNLSIIGG